MEGGRRVLRLGEEPCKEFTATHRTGSELNHAVICPPPISELACSCSLGPETHDAVGGHSQLQLGGQPQAGQGSCTSVTEGRRDDSGGAEPQTSRPHPLPAGKSHTNMWSLFVQVNFVLFISIIRILLQKLTSPDVGGNDQSQYK